MSNVIYGIDFANKSSSQEPTPNILKTYEDRLERQSDNFKFAARLNEPFTGEDNQPPCDCG